MKRKKKPPNPKPRAVLHVAVVCKGPYKPVSQRQEGDWACFFDEDGFKATRRAINAARKWGSEYQVLVGTLTHRAVTKAEFDLELI